MSGHARWTDIGFIGDLTDPAAADELVALAAERGSVEVLVNNAGMTSLADPDEPASVDRLEDAQWRTSLARNLDSMFYMTRAVVRLMRPAGYGRIVNVGSVSGPVVAFPDDVGLPRGEGGRAGVDAVGRARHGGGRDHDQHGRAGVDRHRLAVGRRRGTGSRRRSAGPGTPDEIASIVAYLASRDAAYLTGQLIVVDGGNSIVEAHG